MAYNSGVDAQRGHAEGSSGSRRQRASPTRTAPAASSPALSAHGAYLALIPLRIFLGATFVYAGLDKLTDSAFMAESGPGSIGDMMHAAHAGAAVPALIDLGLENPVAFGYAIALGELAVGIGTLIGLLTRLAAVGGVLISLSLWLTMSWSTTPYYYGNDLAYLMAWLPLVLAGAQLYSLDAVRYRYRRMRA